MLRIRSEVWPESGRDRSERSRLTKHRSGTRATDEHSWRWQCGEGRGPSTPLRMTLCSCHSTCCVVARAHSRYTCTPMSNPIQPNIKLSNTPDYRESYANSVQVRVNVWDFFLVFGTLLQQSESQVEVNNFQGIYLSPQQAKALSAILQQNVAGYESTFGEIKLDPRMMAPGPVH